MTWPVPRLSLEAQVSVTKAMERASERIGQLQRVQHETALEIDAFVPAILDRAFKGDL